MTFEITPVQGTAEELNVDLSAPSQHEREEFVIEEIKKAVDHVVTALGGYLSISCNGNINPVSGENGDLVNIYITSLSAPTSAPTPTVKEAPDPSGVEIGTEPVVIPETPAGITPETPSVIEPVPIGEVGTPEAGGAQEAAPVNTENPTAPATPIVTDNPVENPSALAGETPVPVETSEEAVKRMANEAAEADAVAAGIIEPVTSPANSAPSEVNKETPEECAHRETVEAAERAAGQ